MPLCLTCIPDHIHTRARTRQNNSVSSPTAVVENTSASEASEAQRRTLASAPIFVRCCGASEAPWLIHNVSYSESFSAGQSERAFIRSVPTAPWHALCWSKVSS